LSLAHPRRLTFSVNHGLKSSPLVAYQVNDLALVCLDQSYLSHVLTVAPVEKQGLSGIGGDSARSCRITLVVALSDRTCITYATTSSRGTSPSYT